MIQDEDLERLLRLAGTMADAAGAAALPFFRRGGLGADNKAGPGGYDPVTEADRAAEQAMRALLAEQRPDDGIFGEEGGQQAGSSGLSWVLDPIDGTRAFLCGLPTWGVLVALDDGARTRVGIIDQPYVAERFCGIHRSTGAEAWLEHCGARHPLRVRPCASLEQATMLSTATEMFADPGELAAFEAVRARTRLTRFGTDCYGYAMLAAGHVDLVVEAGLGAYDIAAPGAVVMAAGGIVTDWQGNDCRRGGQVVAAGDPRVHAAALELLNG